MRNAVLPRELNALIGSERKDFAVKAGRAQPRKKSWALLLFGLFWILAVMVVCGVCCRTE